MILKHRDTEVLRFEWLEPEGVRIVSVNEKALRFLPLEMHGEATDERLWSWLRHRIVPKHRFKRHPNYNLSASRLQTLEEFLQNRARLIIEYGAKADVFLHMDEKNDAEQLMEDDAEGVSFLADGILKTISADPYVSQEELSQILGVSRSTIQRQIAELKAQGRLQLVGTGRIKSWKVVRVFEMKENK